MAEKTFSVRTEPHVAKIGEHSLEFEPEVIGAEFADAYGALKTTQALIEKAGNDLGAEELKALSNALREFLVQFMLDDSAKLFTTLKLPDRVLTEMLQWVSELYGSGAQERPTGPSSAS